MVDKIEKIEVLKADQVAKSLGVKTNTIYVWCKRGLIPHYKLEKCIRLRLEDVKDFLEQRRIEGKYK